MKVAKTRRTKLSLPRPRKFDSRSWLESAREGFTPSMPGGEVGSNEYGCECGLTDDSGAGR